MGQEAIVPEVLSPQQLWFLTTNQDNDNPERAVRKPTNKEAEEVFNIMLKDSYNPLALMGFWNRIHKIVYSETIINSCVQKQKISITKAAMRDFKDVSDGQILINQIQVVHERKEDEMAEDSLDADEVLMWHIIKRLPTPKLTNLRRFAFHVCIKKFRVKKGGMKELGKFLEMQRTYMSQMMARIKEEGIFVYKKKKYDKKLSLIKG